MVILRIPFLVSRLRGYDSSGPVGEPLSLMSFRYDHPPTRDRPRSCVIQESFDITITGSGARGPSTESVSPRPFLLPFRFAGPPSDRPSGPLP